MTSEPWSKFYWPDWQSDPRLGVCSLAARGLWLEFLAVMQQANPRGFLLVNDQIPSEKQLASIARCRISDLRKGMAELLAAGVPSVNEAGQWFSRRMVRDQHIRSVNRENAKKGGNPSLKSLKSDIRPDIPSRARGSEVISQEPQGTSKIPSEDGRLGEWPELPASLARKPEERKAASPEPAPAQDAPSPPPSPAAPPTEQSPLIPREAPIDPMPELMQAVGAWNTLAAELGMAQVQRLSDERKGKLRGRLKEAGGLEGWLYALGKVRDSAWLCGERGPWKADFDFMLRASKFTKLMEGGFDDRTGKSNGKHRLDDEQILASALRAAGVAPAAPQPRAGDPGGAGADASGPEGARVVSPAG